MARVVELQGHRGARGLRPENTIIGFRTALAIGVDVLEMDVGVTADGHVVVSHDPALNPDITRTPDGAWLARRDALIHALPRAALAQYDVGRIRPGTPYAARFPDQAPEDGARIPDLADILALDATVKFDIEIKTFPARPDWTAPPADMADAVVAVLDGHGATSRAVVQSFDWRVLRHLRRTRPDVTLSWLTRQSAGAETGLWRDGVEPGDDGGSVARAVAAEGGPIWAPDHDDVTAAEIDTAHALGLRVVTWTVNRAEDMRRMIACGVDGLISDRPDIARAVLAAERLPLPPVRRGVRPA